MLARVAVVAIVAVVAGQPAKPGLRLRAFPLMQTVDISRGCSPVALTAEIVGPEDERFYCPAVEWVKPDGTTSREESDCPPFQKRAECIESQAGCGLQGWHRDAAGRIVERRKDCPCTVIGYPRLWRHNLCAPEHTTGDFWEVEVRLLRGHDLIARETVRFAVK